MAVGRWTQNCSSGSHLKALKVLDQSFKGHFKVCWLPRVSFVQCYGIWIKECLGGSPLLSAPSLSVSRVIGEDVPYPLWGTFEQRRTIKEPCQSFISAYCKRLASLKFLLVFLFPFSSFFHLIDVCTYVCIFTYCLKHWVKKVEYYLLKYIYCNFNFQMTLIYFNSSGGHYDWIALRYEGIQDCRD